MVTPPTIAPACAAAERRHLGVWSACAAEGKCIAPYAHIVLLDHVLDLQLHYVPIYIPLRLHPPLPERGSAGALGS